MNASAWTSKFPLKTIIPSPEQFETTFTEGWSCAGHLAELGMSRDSGIRLEAVEGWAERNATPFVLTKVCRRDHHDRGNSAYRTEDGVLPKYAQRPFTTADPSGGLELNC
ncbi:hypothetical protein NKI95_20405 [Mesorhizobium sp. M0306]|uniref:hypothetical protein n=1 Tax=Mesorhizobium sp. M0306 TaxID=2956932 RepID=UPI003334E488